MLPRALVLALCCAGVAGRFPPKLPRGGGGQRAEPGAAPRFREIHIASAAVGILALRKAPALRRARPEAELRFVDDSARTLLTCASDPRLLPVALHFASYGYSSASQAARIGAVPRMRTLTRSQELDAVFSCAERAE